MQTRFPFRYLVIALSTVLLANIAVAAEAARRPNILMIVADDLGYADVGFQGCTDIPTPNIDSIARNGVRFTNGYVSGPYCSPTRAGLLTGRYQQRFGHEFNPGGEGANDAAHSEKGLPLSETTMANRFKDAGYVTGLVGKWHLGSSPKFHPQQRGFDEFFGFLGGAHTYFDRKGRKIAKGSAPISDSDKIETSILRGTETVSDLPYLTEAFGREAGTFVARHQNEPFLLYLAFNAVHTPMEAPDVLRAEFASISSPERRTYAAMLKSMDLAIGRVLIILRQLNLEEDTLIIFFSDNGGPTMRGTTINGSVNAPLRGSKRTTLEGGIRVPFAIQWKGHIAPGTAFDHPVIQLDVLPTALAAAGVEIKPDWKLDGVNLLPILLGNSNSVPHDTLYWRLGNQNAIRHGEWKLVQYDQNADSPPGKGVSGKRLYRLSTDIGEADDLAGKNPEKVAELEELWQAWSRQLAKPLW